MKLLSYILIFFAFLSTSCSKNMVIITEEQLAEDVFYIDGEIKPFTGKCFIYYENTESVKEMMAYKEGILNGKRISYYKDGSVKLEGNYQNGCLHGTWKSWDENGNQLFEVTYNHDTLEGNCTSWHANGKVKSSGTYLANKKNSDWKYSYQN